jgi:hypothetical protein
MLCLDEGNLEKSYKGVAIPIIDRHYPRQAALAAASRLDKHPLP